MVILCLVRGGVRDPNFKYARKHKPQWRNVLRDPYVRISKFLSLMGVKIQTYYRSSGTFQLTIIFHRQNYIPGRGRGEKGGRKAT